MFAAAESPTSGVVAQAIGGGVSDSPARGILVPDGPEAALVPRDGELLAPGARGEASPPTAGAGRGLSKHSALIAKADSKIRRKATDIVLSALMAPELAEHDPDAVKNAIAGTAPLLPGWTRKRMRIASDAQNSMKSAPAYLAMAQRVVESYKKAEAEVHEPRLNAEIVQVQVNNTYNYPSRVIDED